MKALLLAPMGSVHRRFNKVNIKALQSLGYEVHLAANFEKGNGPEQLNQEYVKKCEENGIKIHSFPYKRHEIKHNIRLVKPTRELIEKERFDIIHAHTETGGLILRLVGKTKGQRIFTPHGMSFYKGAPLKAQLIYRPIERWICARMDQNIAINQEEFKTLKNWNSKTARLVHGIGLDVVKYQRRDREKNAIREELGIPVDALVVLSIGELDDNKNHKIIIDALKESDAYYLICGVGPNEEKLRSQAKAAGMEQRLILAGYRKDIPDIIGASDIFAFPSRHEGLPVSLLEAIAGGVPVVASKIRGIVDLINNGVNGYLALPDEMVEWKIALKRLIDDEALRNKFAQSSDCLIHEYSSLNVMNELLSIYNSKKEQIEP